MAKLGFIVRMCASLAFASVVAAMPPPEHTPATPSPMGAVGAGTAPDGSQDLTVLTYNVHGLPPFLRKSDVAPLAAISDRLRGMREHGNQPNILLLQEAFTDEAKRIGQASGYRYFVHGPTADTPAGARLSGRKTELEESVRWWAGEGMGKHLDSGLQIVSDYPILDVRRLPFPKGACAGYDCLANKGVLQVTVAVPGFSTPVDIVTTHLNSRGAAGVSHRRSLIAYQRQLDAALAFITRNRNPERPLVIAGDFNVGAIADRQQAFHSRFAAEEKSPRLHDVLHAMKLSEPTRFPRDAAEVQKRGKDWQFWSDGNALKLEPAEITVPFGHEPDGSMLSDHMGFVARYRLERVNTGNFGT